MYDVFLVSNDGFGETVFDIGHQFKLEVCSVAWDTEDVNDYLSAWMHISKSQH